MIVTARVMVLKDSKTKLGIKNLIIKLIKQRLAKKLSVRNKGKSAFEMFNLDLTLLKNKASKSNQKGLLNLIGTNLSIASACNLNDFFHFLNQIKAAKTYSSFY